MDIQIIRRKNLRNWVEKHPIPKREKSYFSQLLSGTASFGEKAARRLEEKYEMGIGWLDAKHPKIAYLVPDEEVARELSAKGLPATQPIRDEAQEYSNGLVRLVTIYRDSDPEVRRAILEFAMAVETSHGDLPAREKA